MRLHRFTFLLFACLALAPPTFAQSLAKTFTLNAANQSACIGTSDLPTIGIDLTGTSSLTLQPQVSINGSTPKTSSVTSTVAGSAAQATIVTSGATSASYIAPVGGFDTFCLNVSAYTSGSLTVQLNPSPALNADLLGGGGGGSSAFSAVTSGTNTAAHMVVGTSASLTPSGTGQVTGVSEWYSDAAQAILPATAQASECPTSSSTLHPVDWGETTDANYHSLDTIDTNVPFTNYAQSGFLEFCRPVIFTVGGAAEPSSTGDTEVMTANGAALFYNRLTNNTTEVPFVTQIQADTATTDTKTYNTQIEGLYSEMTIWGSPTLFGGEVNVGGLRGVAAIDGTPAMGATATGAQAVGVSGTSFRGTAGLPTNCNGYCYAGMAGWAINQSASTSYSQRYVGVLGLAADGNHDVSGRGYAFVAKAPGGNSAMLGGANYGFFAENFTNCSQCWDMFFVGDPTDPTQGQGFMNGNLYVGGLRTASTTIGVSGSFLNTGSYGTAQLATPGNPNLFTHGSGGSTNYSYVLTYLDGNGDSSAASSVTTVASAATLDATNYNIICNNPSQNWITSGMSALAVYRTASSGTPSSTGRIGTINPRTVGTDTATAANICLSDTGLAGDGTTAPSVNQTGAVQAFKLETTTNCAVNSVSPAACGTAASGAVVIPTLTTTYTVNTSAVGAHSRILLTWMTFAGDLPGSPTCVAPALTTEPTISGISLGVSFTIALSSTTGTTCPQFLIVDK